MRVHQCLDVSGAFLVDPGREIGFRLIDRAFPARTVIHVHRDLDIIAVFLYGWKRPDLIEAAVPGFSGRHTAVDGNRAAVRYSAAARRCVEDLGYRTGAAAEETRVFVVVRIVLWLQHFYQALYVRAVKPVVVELANIGDDIRHLVNGVVPALRGGTMAAGALDIHADFHAASVSSVNAAVRRFRGNDKFRADTALVDDILPAQAVAVLFHDGADDHQLVSLGDQVHILHDLCAVYRGSHAAFLVGTAAAVDHLIVLIAFVRIIRPVLDIADADRIDMGIDRDDLIALSHPADYIPEAVNFHFVKSELLHFRPYTLHDFLFLAAFTRMGNHRAQKCDHIFFVTLRCCFNRLIIELHLRPPYFLLFILFSARAPGMPSSGRKCFFTVPGLLCPGTWDALHSLLC